MFYVRNKFSGKRKNVYAVSENKEGQIFFLFYHNNMWLWWNADEFEPLS